jgi:hypothetical protein
MRRALGYLSKAYEHVETGSLPKLTHCFPSSPAAAGSLIPFAPFAEIANDLEKQSSHMPLYEVTQNEFRRIEA